MSEKLETKLVTAGRDDRWTKGVVNPPIQRASTVIFKSVADKQHAIQNMTNKELFYGRRGTHTHFALQDAMTEIEGGTGCALFPSGAAAIANAIQAFVSAGDHILMVDSVYEPTRTFCDKVLSRMSVETTYYDPLIGTDIESLIQANTKLIFVESPGSLTMELQDIPAIAKIARQHDIVLMLDNTWGAGVNFSPFEHGVDVSIQAATKYIVGHSDVMMGTAVANARCWPQLRDQSYLMGQCVSPDDAYLALRGLRTLNVRLRQHETAALKVAQWLSERPEVDHVRHPALDRCPGHEFFARDFTGGNGLFSFVLKTSHVNATTALLDGMHHFSMGFSWGGFESLILAHEPSAFKSLRSVSDPKFKGTLIRLHIGLEDVDDLIEDLAQGLERYQQAL